MRAWVEEHRSKPATGAASEQRSDEAGSPGHERIERLQAAEFPLDLCCDLLNLDRSSVAEQLTKVNRWDWDNRHGENAFPLLPADPCSVSGTDSPPPPSRPAYRRQ